MLDSFYTQDLQKIISDSNEDDMLMKYLFGLKQHTDIDRNWDFIAPLISAKKFPSGRWPSPIEFSQSLMQQIAINTVLGKTKEKVDIQTVNGPPGTGKTTLLKDVFVAQIVDQAKAISQLKKPEDGYLSFSNPVVLFGKYKYRGYQLIPSIQGYGTIVSSNNNSAVANISKTFPVASEIKTHATDNANPYLNELNEIDYFKDIEDEILGGETSWGLFAVPMGSRKNQQVVFDALEGQADGSSGLKKEIGTATESWFSAKDRFLKQLTVVNKIESEISRDVTTIQKYESVDVQSIESKLTDLQANHDAISSKVTDLTKTTDLDKEKLSLIPDKKYLIFLHKETEEKQALREAILEQNKNIIDAKKNVLNLETEITETSKRLKKVKQHGQNITNLKNQMESTGTLVPTDRYWNQDNQKIQKNLPNNNERLQDARAKLFIEAMRLRKAFIVGNAKPILNSLKIFENQHSLNFPEDRNILHAAFQIIQLLIPVMSTTLASVQSMFKNFDQNSLDNVVIDEAGQATPASVVGLIWRAKKFIAVGDPAQIKPVVTTDEATLRLIARQSAIDEKYMIPDSSAQLFADDASPWGTYKDPDDPSPQNWIGLPLWVHRRCASPMFDISNSISYFGRMVQGVPNAISHDSTWLDVTGPTTVRQYVPNQAKKVSEHILSQLAKNVNPKDIYVISPFTAVVIETRKYLKRTLGGTISDAKWFHPKEGNIGTVHTFQGKEAKIVYFMIGTDDNTDGAANWAFSEPNLLNVAVTRAKEQLYIVGDAPRMKNKKYIGDAYRLLKKYD